MRLKTRVLVVYTSYVHKLHVNKLLKFTTLLVSHLTHYGFNPS